MSADSRQSVLIVDAHNLIHRLPELARRMRSDPEHARHGLIRRLECLAAKFQRIVVVFDGRGEAKSVEPHAPSIEVVYSPGHLTADSVIERMVVEAPDPGAVTVVTSDRNERHTVEAAGAVSMGCTSFIESLEREERETRSRVRGISRPPTGPRLGDFFPQA